MEMLSMKNSALQNSLLDKLAVIRCPKCPKLFRPDNYLRQNILAEHNRLEAQKLKGCKKLEKSKQIRSESCILHNTELVPKIYRGVQDTTCIIQANRTNNENKKQFQLMERSKVDKENLIVFKSDHKVSNCNAPKENKSHPNSPKESAPTSGINVEIKTLTKHFTDYPKRKMIEWEFCHEQFAKVPSDKASQKLKAVSLRRQYLLEQTHVIQAQELETKVSRNVEEVKADQKPKHYLLKESHVVQASNSQTKVSHNLDQVKANQKPKRYLLEQNHVIQANKSETKPSRNLEEVVMQKSKCFLLQQNCMVHKCETCWKSFATERSLVAHIKMHLGYNGEPKAKFKYRSIRDTKPFHCKKCDKCFRAEEHLEKHMHKMHKGDNMYKCEFCGESDRNFSRKTRLLEHMSQHRAL